MWIYSKKQSVWVNLDNAMRIGKSGNNDYIVVCSDGTKVSIDQETYDYSVRYIDPQFFDKRGKDLFDFEKTIKVIAKAVGAKIENEKEEEGEGD